MPLVRQVAWAMGATEPSASSTLYARLIDLSFEPQFVWTLAAPRRIVLWNTAAERLYGVPAAGARDRDPRQLFETGPEVDWSAVDAALAASGEWRGRLRQRRSRGEVLIIETAMRVVDESAGEPLVLEAGRDVTAEQQAKARLATSSRRVLVVDDNTDAAELLGELLELSGYDVRVANDAGRAHELVLEHAPQVAVLDIGMPVTDGCALARALRSKLGLKAPVLVALSGYGQASDRERSEAAGFSAHLVKPVDATKLLATLDTLFPQP